MPDSQIYSRYETPNVLTVIAIVSHVVSAPAGEAVASSKQVVAPPPPAPVSYFRRNEFSLGLFGSYGWTYNNNVGRLEIMPGEVVLTVNIFRSNFSVLQWRVIFFNEIPGDFFGSTVTGNVILRYPLDINFPGFHLALYAFGGVGGVFNQNKTFTRVATVGHPQVLNRSGAQEEVLGDGGLGLEYRFTPHIGLFSDVRYNVVNRSKNNFLSTRFGLRFAF